MLTSPNEREGVSAPSTGLLLPSTEVNQDGRSSSLTAPNGPAQQSVIHGALVVGAVSSSDVGTLGMHGTGTALGDPIEVTAASAVLLTAERSAALTLSAVKSYVGHTEGAAGTAGLVQALISLQKRAVAPVLHFRATNLHITTAIEARASRRKHTTDTVDLSLTKIVAGSQGGATGVSSFAFQGTNAHTIVSCDSDEGVRAPCIAPQLRGWDRATYWYAPLPRAFMGHTVQHTRDSCVVALDLSHATAAWLGDHLISRRAIVPLAAFVEAIAAVPELLVDAANKHRTALVLSAMSMGSPVSAAPTRGSRPTLLLTCAFSRGDVFVAHESGGEEAPQTVVLTCQLGRAPNALSQLTSPQQTEARSSSELAATAAESIAWPQLEFSAGDRSRPMWRGEVYNQQGYNLHPALLEGAVHLPHLFAGDGAGVPTSVASAVEGCVVRSRVEGRRATGVLPLLTAGAHTDADAGAGYSIQGSQSQHVNVEVVRLRTMPLANMASGGLDGVLALVGVDGETEATEAAATDYEVNERLKAMEDEERTEYIFAFIKDAVTDAIGDEVEMDAELMEAGLDSLAFVDLRNKIVEEMGVDLEVTIFFDYRTTTALCNRVDVLVAQACRGETQETGFAFMRTVRPDRTAIPLFLGAPAFGDGPLAYLTLIKALPTYGNPVFTLERNVELTWPVNAQNHVEQILAIQESGPCLLGGHSLGGILAIESAILLEDLGHEVGQVFAWDSPQPTQFKKFEMPEVPEVPEGEEGNAAAADGNTVRLRCRILPTSSHSTDQPAPLGAL